MKTIKCTCGKASMVYEVIGEDLYSGITVNTKLEKVKYGGVICVCKNCGSEYDNYDSFMVKIIENK